jgi:hypothetical protein
MNSQWNIKKNVGKLLEHVCMFVMWEPSMGTSYRLPWGGGGVMWEVSMGGCVD